MNTRPGAPGDHQEWTDSHCHLHLCEDEGASIAQLIRAAARAGVGSIVAVGIDVESSNRAITMAREYEGVFATAGVHPNSAADFGDAHVEKLDALLTKELVVGVGESGLDFYRDESPRPQQERAFRAHIELARAHDKALIIHTRDSTSGALDVLENASPPPRLVFHCWSGSEDELRRALDMGSFISLAGNASFKSAEDLRAKARRVPRDRLLVETDSPFLAPVPHRGRRNQPAFVADVGRAVSVARDEPAEAVAAATTSNARALFGLAHSPARG